MNREKLMEWFEPLRDLWTSFLNSSFFSAIQSVLPGKSAIVLVLVLVGLGFGAFIFVFVKRIRERSAKPKRFIRQLIKDRKFQEAGEIFLSEGNFDKAMNLFLQGKAYSRVARVYEMRGQFLEAGEYYEKVQLWSEAVDAYREGQKIERAGKILMDQGEIGQAAKLYKDAGLLSLAANAYGQNMQKMEAAKIYERLEDFEKSGDMYSEELTQQVRSIRGQISPQQWEYVCSISVQGAQAYLKGGFQEKAADLFVKGEKFEEAARLFQEIEEWDKAVEALKKGKRYEQAAKVYEKIGRTHDAHQMYGEHYRIKSMFLEAAEHFTKAGNFNAAGELWMELGEKKRAAECFKEGGEYVEAAALFARINDHQNSAICYEKAGVLGEAANQYAQVGNASKRTELLIKGGKFFEAGEILIKEGLLDKAINVLQEIPNGTDDFLKAASHLGKIFFDKGMLGVSLKKFQQAINKQSVRTENLKDYYHMGVIYERMGNHQESALIYEQILATDYNYSDVASRLGNVQLEISRAKEISVQRKPELFEPTIMVPEDSNSSGNVSDNSQRKRDRFELLDEIGRGGMGIVYKARDRILNRIVALKYLPANFSQNATAVKNFRREAQSTARLNHTGIVTIFDVGCDSRGNFIAMEHLEGKTVKDYIRAHGALEIQDIFVLLRQMTDALAYAHDNKIIHRDIKTSNLMWCDNGNVVIMDFGLAKFMQNARNNATQISGTPYYMSPEQTIGKELDHRTDIYSLGVSLFEMATGVVPFKQGDVGYHHVHTPPPDPLDFNPKLPKSLREIIWKCMEKKAEMRYEKALNVHNMVIQAHADWVKAKREIQAKKGA